MSKCWHNYSNPEIAARQRKLVDRQLKDMRMGKPPGVFAAIEPALSYIAERDENLHILDAGCASGYYSEIMGYYAADIIQRYAGIDFNRGMIALARSLYPSHTWYVGNLTNLSAFNTRDLVFSSGTIQHIENWQRAIGELVRVTKRWLLLHRTRVWWDNDRETEFICEPAYDIPVNVWIFNRKQLIELIKGCGMSMVLELPAGEGPTIMGRWQILLHLWEKNDNI